MAGGFFSIAVFAAVNPPIDSILPAEIPQKTGEVLIYYANETAPDKFEANNYNQILLWLDNIQTQPKAKEIARQLRRDLKEFHEVVDSEIRDLRAVIKTSTNSRFLGIIIFTNRLTRMNKLWVIRNRSRTIESHPFSVSKSDNYILNSNPLATPEALSAALRSAARLFDPKVANFILVTKSHGAKERALTTRLVVRSEETSQNDLAALISNPDQESPPRWIKERLGVSKTEYVEILAKTGTELGVFFSLVFLESCSSEGGDLSQSFQRAPNVATFVTTDGGIPYRTFNYNGTFGIPNHIEMPSTEMKSELRKQAAIGSKGQRKTKARESNADHPSPLIYYYLPLLAVMAGMAINSIRKRAS